MTFFILSAFPLVGVRTNNQLTSFPPLLVSAPTTNLLLSILAGVHTNKEKSYQVFYLNVSTVENGIFAA
jgi:hypothetical protein